MELILHNGKFFIGDGAINNVSAILVRDGLITAMGESFGAISELLNDGSDSQSIDLEGRLVLPGFIDAHLHAVEAGINEANCLVDEIFDLNELPFYFEDCGVESTAAWLVGSGIDVSVLIEDVDFSESPIDTLDRLFSTPVLVLDNLGHGAIANSAAFQAAGLDVLSPTDPPGGRWIRDGQGRFTGIVLENAQQPLRNAAFPPDSDILQDQSDEALLKALRVLAANGVTTVSDAGGFWLQAQTSAWARIETAGELTVRAANALYVYPDIPIEEQISSLNLRFTNDPTQLSNFNIAKVYVDGILSLTTAALLEPYESGLQLDASEQLGFEYFGNATYLNQVTQTLIENNFALHFHVVGDRGFRLALDAIEAAGAVGLPDGRKHRVTHCFLVDPADRSRLPQLDVVADFQLAPSSASLDNLDFMGQLIGDRANELLPAVPVLREGALMTISSDWDADILSPLVKLETVLNRPFGESFESLDEVIPLMTKNAATLLNTNGGSIAVGKDADFAILDKDIFQVPASQISEAKVVMTIFGGKIIFDPTGISDEIIGEFPTDSSFAYPTGYSLFAPILVILFAIHGCI